MPICKRYVALDPEGQVCGPCTPDEETCWRAMCQAYERIFKVDVDEEHIHEMGYQVVLATVEWLSTEADMKTAEKRLETVLDSVISAQRGVDHDLPE